MPRPASAGRRNTPSTSRPARMRRWIPFQPCARSARPGRSVAAFDPGSTIQSLGPQARHVGRGCAPIAGADRHVLERLEFVQVADVGHHGDGGARRRGGVWSIERRRAAPSREGPPGGSEDTPVPSVGVKYQTRHLLRQAVVRNCTGMVATVGNAGARRCRARARAGWRRPGNLLSTKPESARSSSQ